MVRVWLQYAHSTGNPVMRGSIYGGVFCIRKCVKVYRHSGGFATIFACLAGDFSSMLGTLSTGRTAKASIWEKDHIANAST